MPNHTETIMMPLMTRLGAFLRWLANLLAPQPVRVKVIQRDITRLTVAEWRSDEGLTQSAFKALHDPTVRRMLDVIWNDIYLRQTTAREESPKRRIAHVDEQRGYILCLGTFESLGVLKQPDKMPQIDFSDKNAEIEIEEDFGPPPPQQIKT